MTKNQQTEPLTAEQEEQVLQGLNLIGNAYPELHDEWCR